jgi:NADH dehydrogenase
VLSEGDIAPATGDVLRQSRTTKVLIGEAVDIDLGSGDVILDTIGRPMSVPFDGLIVAAGATQSYLGYDEFAADPPAMKTIDDVLELRGRIFGALGMAELDSQLERRDAWLTFAVVGAGPAGVEVAGQIAELSSRGAEAQLPEIRSRQRGSSCSRPAIPFWLLFPRRCSGVRAAILNASALRHGSARG